MNLKDWLRNGWLKEHKTSPEEIQELFKIAARDLKDCRTKNLSSDWRLNIAYNAALQSATAALAAAGYRTTGQGHHYRVIQSLAYTIKPDRLLVEQLDQFRQKRNISDYERSGIVSEKEVKEMTALAVLLKDQVEKWLRQNYSRLME